MAIFQVIAHNSEGATVALEGFVVSLIPLAIAGLSKTHVPRPLELAFVFGMALQFISESTKLFELFYYWDKLVHPTLIALTGMISAWLLVGYRDTYRKRIPIHLVAVFGMLLAISIGAFWEFVEFTTDWFSNADLQKSNADTITDIMSNDIGGFLATLLGLWLYTHVFKASEKEQIGRIAWWLMHGPSRLIAAHGRLIGTALTAAFVALLFMSQWVDRNVPALASGLTPGTTQTWNFVNEGIPPQAVVLSGDWVADPRGVCRENLEDPKPGSEKAGVLELTPDRSYQSFAVQARYYEERPPVTRGSEMDAGIAFGIRDAQNFDLVEQNALHDILRLDEFIHDNRRPLREKLLRTHGDEWHTLMISVNGSTITVGVDGQPIYTVDNVPNTDGPIGLWARAAAPTCFSDVTVSVNQ